MTTKSKTKAGPREAGRQSRTLLHPEEFAAGIQRERLAEGVLLAGSPAVLAGGRMELTGFAVDLAVSLATGTPFLGHFPVTRPRRVALYCCGARPTEVMAQAGLVATARGTDLTAGRFYPGVRVPGFRTRAGFEKVVAEVRREEIEVAVIDPVARALRAGGDGNPPELSDADRLAAVGDAFLDAGVTPVFAHRTGWDGREVGIAGLGYAALNEYARQWLLVRRLLPAARYGSDTFRLTAGGEAGHDGVWCVRVSEGRLHPDFSGRTWDVVVAEGEEFHDHPPQANAILTEDEAREIVEMYKAPKAKRLAGASTGRRA